MNVHGFYFMYYLVFYQKYYTLYKRGIMHVEVQY